MQYNKLFFGLMVAALLCLMIPTAQAEAVLTSTNNIISSTPTASGGDVTLYVTITNNGITSLTNVTVTENSLLGGSDPAATRLLLGRLDAGHSASATWTISTANYSEQLKPGVPLGLLLHVTGMDAAGNTVAVDVNSDGGL